MGELVEARQNRSLASIYPIIYLDAIHIKLRREGKVENIAVYTVLAVFPQTQIQRCIIHQIRNSLKYVTWHDRKKFMTDLKEVYQAATRESAEANLRQLSETWGDKYAVAIRSWQNHWEDLATYFAYPSEIRCLLYTTNAVEGYHRQLRKITKAKSIFPTPRSGL